MRAGTSVKISKSRAQLVGVIASRADLHLALRMGHPPDFFEVRLDGLLGCLDELERKLAALPAPLIITARHPAEGGAGRLSTPARCRLLRRFLPHARYIDLELRCARQMAAALKLTGRPRRIVSFHDFKSTPTTRALQAKARKAAAEGATIFKVATRTDTPPQLEQLLDFAASNQGGLPVSAMGMGRLGAISRLVCAQLGSVLHYGSLGRPTVPGQLSIGQLRDAFSALKITQGWTVP